MILVLTLAIAGRSYHVAERGLVTSDGVLLLGGLASGDYEEGIDLFGVGSPDTWSSDVVLPPDIDMGALVGQGHQPWAEEAELAIFDPASTWSARRVLKAGTSRITSWGNPGDAIRVELLTDSADDSASFPPDEAKITTETMGSRTIDQANENAPYPWIIGQPGTFGATTRAGSPCYVIDVVGNRLDILVAGGRTTPGTVTIRHAAGVPPSTHTGTTVLDVDDLGQEFTRIRIADYTAAGSLTTWVLGATLTCTWGTAEGTLDPFGPGSIRTAGKALRWALSLASVRVDWPRVSVAAYALTMRLDGYWDGSCAPWEWVRDQILSLVPCSVRYGPHGRYPVVLDWAPDPATAVHRFEIGVNACLIPPVESTTESMVSTVIVRYMRQPAGDYLGQFAVKPTVPKSSKTGMSLPALMASQAMPTATKTIDADLVSRPEVAQAIASIWSAILGQPEAPIELETSEGSTCQPGEIIQLSAPNREYPACLIVKVRRVGPLWNILVRPMRRW